MFDTKKCDCGCAETGDFVTAAEIAKYISSSRVSWTAEDTRNLAHARAVNARAKTFRAPAAA